MLNKYLLALCIERAIQSLFSRRSVNLCKSCTHTHSNACHTNVENRFDKITKNALHSWFYSRNIILYYFLHEKLFIATQTGRITIWKWLRTKLNTKQRRYFVLCDTWKPIQPSKFIATCIQPLQSINNVHIHNWGFFSSLRLCLYSCSLAHFRHTIVRSAESCSFFLLWMQLTVQNAVQSRTHRGKTARKSLTFVSL